MTVKLHHLLKTCAQVAGFLSGAVFALLGGPQLRFFGVPFPYSAAGPILVGVLIPSLLFRFIPAVCPRCGKTAQPKGMGRYICRTCGYDERMPGSGGGEQILH
jgi:hypothetical protein